MEFYDLSPSTIAYVNQTEVVQKKKQDHEFKLVVQQKRIPGLTMWCINLKTGEIKPAPIKYECIVDLKTRKPIRKQSIVVEPHTLYRQCLNRKNFIKILLREGVLIRRLKQK